MMTSGFSYLVFVPKALQAALNAWDFLAASSAPGILLPPPPFPLRYSSC